MKKIKVLVVDDDMKFAENIGKYLSIIGYDVNAVGTGESAFKLIASTTPDIILCDLKLSDMNGEKIVKKVKETSPNTALFIISAYIDPYTEERLQNQGIPFIRKPVLFDDVVALFKKAVS
ncbi:MAG: response regulator [Candidatus Omnitrophica bacterium]|nr:response regulator [Candidatus Omnitrophota bacterium]